MSLQREPGKAARRPIAKRGEAACSNATPRLQPRRQWRPTARIRLQRTVGEGPPPCHKLAARKFFLRSIHMRRGRQDKRGTKIDINRIALWPTAVDPARYQCPQIEQKLLIHKANCCRFHTRTGKTLQPHPKQAEAALRPVACVPPHRHNRGNGWAISDKLPSPYLTMPVFMVETGCCVASRAASDRDGRHEQRGFKPR